MKISLVVFAVLWSFAASTPVQQFQVADKVYLKRELKVLELFYHINQPSYLHGIDDTIKSFSITNNVASYKDPEVHREFLEYWTYGILPRGHIFSVFNKDHLDQAIALFRLFDSANDWDTFYLTACWARQNVNEGMFTYALALAVVHRPDCRGLMLPPIYEIYPHFFFNSDVINKAYYYKQVHDARNVNNQAPIYTIESNYSGFYLNLHTEQRTMSYYLEDVGLSAFYFYYNIHYPWWMKSMEYGLKDTNRGQLFLYFYQQILARYYLERLCNGLGEIPWFNWDLPIETPYQSSLVYPNGLEFPNRPKFARLHEYFYNYGQKWTHNIYGYSYSFVLDNERRINDAIDSGVVFDKNGNMSKLYTPEGLNILGNMIEANPDSPNYQYHGSVLYFARHVLGYAYQALDTNQIVPSALEHISTSWRDPIFFQMYKKIINKAQRYFSRVAPYTKNELSFPGVKITKVEFDPLITFQDAFFSDLTNAVSYYPGEDVKNFRIRARQMRQNNKPFTYKVCVDSDKSQKAVVKILLGPKYDSYGREMNLTESRVYFVEFDHFVYDLKAGSNDILRNSQDNAFFGPDRISYNELYTRVSEALKGNAEFKIDWRQNHFLFPQRFMLPKGSPGGTPYQFYVIVYPYVPYHAQNSKQGNMELYIDNSTLGYPFDRFIKFERMWYHLPNHYFQEEKIYFKDVHEVNSPA